MKTKDTGSFRMKKQAKLYEEIFTKDKNERVEYGNIENSFRYFKKFKIKKDSQILDVGTNIGTLPNLMSKADWKNVFGIDVTKNAIGFGKKKYPKISKNLIAYNGEKIPFKNNSFDVVTSFDVIEHIPKPSKILDEIYRVLKPNGIFIFQTPNKIINSCWETLQFNSLNWKKYHCSLQTPISLKKLLENSNFHEIIIEKFSISTKYNKDKVKKKLGIIFIPLLYVADLCPLIIFPNLWGSCKK